MGLSIGGAIDVVGGWFGAGAAADAVGTAAVAGTAAETAGGLTLADAAAGGFASTLGAGGIVDAAGALGGASVFGAADGALIGGGLAAAGGGLAGAVGDFGSALSGLGDVAASGLGSAINPATGGSFFDSSGALTAGQYAGYRVPGTLAASSLSGLSAGGAGGAGAGVLGTADLGAGAGAGSLTSVGTGGLVAPGGYSLGAGTAGITSDVGAGAASGGMSLTDAARIAGQGLNVASGINGLSQAQQLQNQAAAADPLAQYRPQFAAQLAALMANPSTITSYPGYQAGLEAVERAGASQGFTGSGNMMDALSKYGGGAFNTAVSQLQGLAGGTAGGGLAAQQSSINLTNASLNRIASGIASMGT